MEITFAPNGNLQIDDAKLRFRNFAGRPGAFNKEGERSFSLVVESPEDAERLTAAGWNVRIKTANEEGELPSMHLPVKVKFNGRGPHVYLVSGDRKVKLDEESVGCLDDVYILRVDLDIRPYDWEVRGDTGRTAYLHSMQVVQELDRFAQMDNEY